MAIASVGSLTTTNSTASSSTLVTPAVSVSAGRLLVALISKDNVSTTTGNTNEVTSVTDSAGNTWTKGYEYCLGGGSAGAGMVIAIYYSVLTNALSSGTITANFSSAIAAKAISVWQYTVGAAISSFGTPQGTTASTTTTPGSQTISGLASASYLAIRGIGVQPNLSFPSLTVTAGYTAFTTAFTGSAGTDSGLVGEFIISTATSFTSNPTAAPNNDSASAFIVLGESVAPATTQNTLFFGML